jgi:hypothetical protein
MGALLTVWLASYFTGLDLIFSIIFTAIIMIESITGRGEIWSGLATVLIWQLPGMILSLCIISGLSNLMPGGEYYIFILELWYTPVIPLISLISTPFLPYPLYYNLLLIMPLIMIIYYMLGFIPLTRGHSLIRSAQGR